MSDPDLASRSKAIMASFATITRPFNPDAAKAVLAEATIVTAGQSPSAPVQQERRDSAATPLPLVKGKRQLEFRNPKQRRGESSEPPKGTAVPAGQPAFPPLAEQAANLFRATVAFVGDGFAMVDDAEYRCRLDVCRTCDRRAGRRCTACGCWIGLKARGRVFACPLGRWPWRFFGGRDGISHYGK